MSAAENQTSVLTRYKRKGPVGLREFAGLLESTPLDRRKRILETALAEDPRYVELAQKYVYVFDDVFKLPSQEFDILMGTVPPRLMGVALQGVDPEQLRLILQSCQPRVRSGIQEVIDQSATPVQISGARYKVIEFLRGLEKSGHILTKAIPGKLPDLG